MSININNVDIFPEERLDDLGRAGFRIIQNPGWFCFGVDAVLLSAFAKVYCGETALDLCCGNGVIPVLLSAKTQGAAFHGLEIAPENVEMARRSVRLNNLTDKVYIQEGDVKLCEEYYKPSSFDVATANPPYIARGGGVLSGSLLKDAAKHELLCGLDDVVSAAARMLKTSGRFYMVHRPHRLVDLFAALRCRRLEPKVMRLVYSSGIFSGPGREPVLVLIESVKNAGPMLKVAPPLVIYGENGEYTDEVYAMYYK
ncbi:MAG: tRNA1(Val) (adenine(37)-N6)-methyltransferase [Clostridiales bacterium]|jgi:tRNA1Val (adenine37-N6)-methyltransferase|nr:tRNA1(Val) (adenine(37)-N6)-methyltransferase [Clostridiales bacterium]